MNTWRRRLATGADDLAEAYTPRPLVLETVAAVWASGGTGSITVAVDGRPIASAVGTGSALVRLDRPEAVPEAATITVQLPAPGTCDLRGTITP